MRIGMIGLGPFGRNLGLRLAGAGHTLIFGTRAPGEHRAEKGVARVEDIASAMEQGEAVVLAVPGVAVVEALTPGREGLRGKLLIDCTNLLHPDWTPVGLEGGRSNAERLQDAFPEARVVKAFNTVFADMLARPLAREDSVRPATFVCADDRGSAEVVAGLARDIGLEPVLAGGLAAARHAEALAHLHIQIATAGGRGTRGGLAYLPG